MNDDIRDLAGRARRLVVASVIGTVLAIAIAILLPQRDHGPNFWHTCMGGGGPGIDFAIVIAGAVGLTLGCYAVLQAIARHQKPQPFWLPRAIVVSRGLSS